MLLFCHSNVLQSMQDYAGTSGWNVFLFSGAVPATEEAIPFDPNTDSGLLQNAVDAFRVSSALLTSPSYMMELTQTQRLYGYPAAGRDEAETSVSGVPVYSIGMRDLTGTTPNLNLERKLDVLSARLQYAFTAAVDANQLNFDLWNTADVSHVTVTADPNTQYTVFAYDGTTETELFTQTGSTVLRPVTAPGAIRLIVRFAVGSCGFTKFVPYTSVNPNDSAVVPTWAIIRPVAYNSAYVPAGASSPFLFCTAGGPATTAEMRLSKAQILPQQHAALMYARLKPEVTEI